MNKIVAILGIIVVIMLGGLFFCAGFFTGSSMNSTASSVSSGTENTSDKSTKDNVDALLDTKSETLSEKVMDLLASAADSAISTAENLTAEQNQGETSESENSDEQMTVDSLLREIASSHTSDDHCSPQTTQAQMDAPKPKNLQQGMQGKKIVFIGYFKNKIALQIQQLLQSKGYKTHVEISKAGEQNEAFVFCGPFKQEKNARKLVTWLRRHNFKEAHLISVSKEAIEETLYDFISEDSKLPTNAEKDIPEMSEDIENNQTNDTVQIATAPQQQPIAQPVMQTQVPPQQQMMPQQVVMPSQLQQMPQ
ncbi:MAG: hypothetical protein K6C34_05160 [Alphaproteobacteria bacterium]|nr:hypothetical protein [Alphaproteobacteria bacterium]